MFNKNKRDRVLIKVNVPYLKNLLGNGIEYVYKNGYDSSYNGKKYWKNFGKWKKNIKYYKLIVLGENFFNHDVSRYIKETNPDCKVIVFFWNKLNLDWYSSILEDPNVDDFYTFDENDSKKYNLKFNSTFFSKKLKLPVEKCENDIFFIGREKDRKDKILYLKNKLDKLNIKTNFIIVNDETSYIDYKKVLSFISKSKAILDFNAYNQNGLSLRVMESIFFEKKLITTNKNIINYNFYNQNNIFIIGKDNLDKLKDFLNSEYVKIDNSIVEYYDFENWIKRFK